jgi:para-aminobenzoate synthetase component 1
VLLFIDRLLAWDHRRGRVHAFAMGCGPTSDAARRRAQRSLEGMARGRLAPRRGRGEPTASFAAPGIDAQRAAHAKAVARVKEEIEAGNVYQACLTQRFERAHTGDSWQLYRALRRLNPAPFACYLELPEVAVVGSSPERFLRLSPDRVVESRPIKGTRPRGRSPAEDASLRRDLESSAKDRAENLMIVDLVRNDLGRVCETGSVEVPELMAVEAYASVFQLVSTVRGRLRADRDVFDLVRAAFPPGSMTGAPKIAAMRLLGGLEPVRRSFYSGAVGYLDARGGADLAVVIRTLLVQRGRACVHSGGGIVADSEAAAEWREALDKAAPLFAALDEAERRGG